MADPPLPPGSMAGTAAIAFNASAGIGAFQFLGLLRLTEYNAARAAQVPTEWLGVAYVQNCTLTDYAALEALVQETAAELHRPLYDKGKKFLHLPLIDKYADFLKADLRPNDSVLPIIAEISEARHALTHAEPYNDRTRSLGATYTPEAAARYASGVRATALWLWNGRRPGAVAAEFDDPHPYIQLAR